MGKHSLLLWLLIAVMGTLNQTKAQTGFRSVSLDAYWAQKNLAVGTHFSIHGFKGDEDVPSKLNLCMDMPFIFGFKGSNLLAGETRRSDPYTMIFSAGVTFGFANLRKKTWWYSLQWGVILDNISGRGSNIFPTMGGQNVGFVMAFGGEVFMLHNKALRGRWYAPIGVSDKGNLFVPVNSFVELIYTIKLNEPEKGGKVCLQPGVTINPVLAGAICQVWFNTKNGSLYGADKFLNIGVYAGIGFPRLEWHTINPDWGPAWFVGLKWGF